MRFENANQSSFLGKWKYSVKLVHQLANTSNATAERWRSKQEFLAVEALEGYLKVRATGPWTRNGNVIYLETLEDAFNLRLYFEPHIKVIRKALGFVA